ncbi:MAG: tRNA uridine-5-carboxymethylaminomethyl(34) synthesis GTPase MnmE [Candidatus Cloacimonetes bacterium]|nr:tRNA uridine-5-carboxymethylaminomethyl(34) synthesis GTPase MnmE [Candidatus Cloacimonadota bacterium]
MSTTDLHNSLFDTIVALSTPMGKGALAVIRVSGEQAIDAVIPLFRSMKDQSSLSREYLKIKKRLFGIITDNEKKIDEVILSFYEAPHSYTGEDVIEISCHCNPFIVREIIQLILKKARIAKPGEFTRRAFFNNRIDLTRAEAVGDLLNARTEFAHHAALSQLEGSLYKKIAKLLDELTSYRIELELEIDFSEQDLPEINTDKLRLNLLLLQKDLEKLLATGKEGMIIREGLKVCLTGAPNVGKSSLFNYLLTTERAIVTSIPGTTRDYLEESLSIDGYLVKLYDTAGLRAATEEVEILGIARTQELIKQAEQVVYIEDGSQSSNEFELQGFNKEDPRVIKVLNKADIIDKEKIDEYKEQGFIICSVKTGQGIDVIKERMIGGMSITDDMIDSGILSNLRQIEAVEKSIRGIEHAIKSLDYNLGHEFTAFDLKEASAALEEIIGKITTDDMLNRIFADFCIGK